MKILLLLLSGISATVNLLTIISFDSTVNVGNLSALIFSSLIIGTILSNPKEFKR